MKVTYYRNNEIVGSQLLKCKNNKINQEKTISLVQNNCSFDKIWRTVQTERLIGKNQNTPNFILKKKTKHLSNENQMLSEKYKPKHYFELIGNHKMNRNIISWMKAHQNKNFKANPFYYFDEQQTKVRNQYKQKNNFLAKTSSFFGFGRNRKVHNGKNIGHPQWI